MLDGREDLKKSTPFTIGYFLEMFQVVMITLLLFMMFTLSHLEHGIAFIFPVPIAIFVIRYHLKDSILPAVIMIIGAALITHFLPLNDGYFLRGLLVMTTCMALGIMHGILFKLRVKPLKEIMILVGIELFFAVLMKIIFYYVQDPYYSFSIEFEHVFHELRAFFGLNESAMFTKNIGVIFPYMVVPYTFALAFIEVLFTHMIIHLFIKYVYGLTFEKTFHGLRFRMKPYNGIIYLVGILLSVAGLIALDYALSPVVMTIIIVVLILTLMATIFFLFQGVIFLMKLTRVTLHRELGIVLFFISLLLIIPFALLGAISVTFNLRDKLAEKRPKNVN